MRKLLLLAALLLASPAFAQAPVIPCQAATAGGCVNVSPSAPLSVLPSASMIAGNAAGSTGAVVGTLAASTTKTTLLCEFDISAIGGTAAVGPITVAGLLGGSRIYQMSATAAGAFLSKSFSPCLSGSAINTAITITTTADGTATAVNVNSSGYQQ
jgi:hypothetical protein